MADDEIETLEAGRELDALVAVAVFGWRWMKYPAPNMSDGTKLTVIAPPDAPKRWPSPNFYWKGWEPSDSQAKRFSDWASITWWDNDGADYHHGLPHYSTDIAAAWQVVEKLRDMWTAATDGIDGMNDNFTRPFADGIFFDMLHRNADRRWPWAFLYVTPEAICRAALRAIRATRDETV